jgi:predicted phosphodiesterase
MQARKLLGATGVTRIVSDLHYGDPASRVRSLEALRPLFDGADRVVFNGDSLETRRSPAAQQTAAIRQEFIEFARASVPCCTIITGNHDPEISTVHYLELLGGLVFVTHGEVLFDDLVPWSRELPEIGEFYRQELAALPADMRALPGERLAASKRACSRFELSHDPHPRHPWGRIRRAVGIFWPPGRVAAMMKAWNELPLRAAAFARQFRPCTRFVFVGHTHRPGVWTRSGMVVVNTGSFCPPFGCYAIDVSTDQIVVRRVRHACGCFALGSVVAAFALAPTRDGLPDSGSMMPDLAPAP